MIDTFQDAYTSKYLLQTNNFSEGARTMLHVAAVRLAEVVALNEDRSKWARLIAESLGAGLDIHTEQQLGYWLPCLIWKPWATPLGLYVLSLSIQHIPWSHHWAIREQLSDHDRFGVFFGVPCTPMHQRIPPLPPKIIRKIDQGLQFWARLLKSLGVTLEAYGERESQTFHEAELQREFEFEQ